MKKVVDLIKFFISFIVTRIIVIFPKYKNIWIITERRAECKDNGYYLFKYIRNYFPKLKVYYAIDKSSNQINKIKDLGNVIYYNSLKHYIYALIATRLIGAFLPCGIPDSFCFYKFPNLYRGKKVFLQHGIIKELMVSLLYKNTKLDLFICGAKPEYDYVSKNYGYKNQVKYTGLCRYDGLFCNSKKNYILIMPTWRQWIPSKTWHTKYAENLDEIEYFYTYKSLINNHKLISSLKEYGYQLVFFLHHEMQAYINYFKNIDNSIIIASEESYDVQDLLKSAQLLITDYSSVAFDFAYMKKPVVYYQFDEKQYYAHHYKKGYFDYDRDGFGKKCIKLDDVVDETLRCLKNGFEMDACYSTRVDRFFIFRDEQNCKRVFDEIMKL